MNCSTEALTDRRVVKDRRIESGMLSSLKPFGRRRCYRRDDETRSAYVDVMHPSVLGMVLFLVVASGLDALFTLIHLERGAAEANPMMDSLLQSGPIYFVAVKMALTAFGALFLALHQLFPLGYKSLKLLSVFYVALLIYHGLLLYIQRGIA